MSQNYQLFFIEEEKNSDHRLSIISQKYYPLKKDFIRKKTKERRRFLFIIEPIIIGLIIFPIIVLFWECGWNLILIQLDSVNGYPLQGSEQQSPSKVDSLFLTVRQKSSHKEYSIEGKKRKNFSRFNSFLNKNPDSSIPNLEVEDFSSQSLIIPYIIAQIFLLCFYLSQDLFYNFLKKQNNLIGIILLKCHIFFLASIYIIQWVMIWGIWDQYTPLEWHFELLLSLTFLFVLIIFNGHLSDLICAPFIVSYDSIEYCLQIDCPLETQKMKKWKINLINFIFYDIIISNITIIVWRGFYGFLDLYFYPDDFNRSAWFCLLIGYILYFPLMYFQNYLEDFNLKHEFWIFISINFPQFYRNIRHFLAFISYLCLWRGLWILYDLYIDIFEYYYQTYSLLYLLSFLFLALIQTASSINGPLNNMEDEYRFFPLYSNCYVSTAVRKFYQLSLF